MNNKKVSFDAIMFALSYWLIFITFEGSFSVQILLPVLILMIIYKVFIDINLIVNIKYFNINTIIGLLYFIVIFLWYIVATNKVYTDKEINMIKNSYIIVSVICSIFLIERFLSGQTGKIAMVNLVGMEIDENYVSAIIAMATLLVFQNILSVNKKLWIKLINIIYLIINIFAVALSGSRAALIGLAIAMGMQYVIMFFEKINLKRILKFILIIIIVTAIGIKVFEYIPTWTYNRYFNSNYVDKSNSKRILMWKNGMRGIIKNPITGYSVRIFDKIPEFGTINDFEIPDRVPAHQTYLDILIYSGLIGFIPFILFLYYLFKAFLKKEKFKYVSMILLFLFITNIIGAERSVFFWNTLIILTIIKDNIDSKDKKQDKLEIIDNNEIVVKNNE